MNKYQVEITETLQRIIEVEADSPDVAVDRVKTSYKHEEIVLDSSDYMDTEISLFCDN